MFKYVKQIKTHFIRQKQARLMTQFVADTEWEVDWNSYREHDIVFYCHFDVIQNEDHILRSIKKDPNLFMLTIVEKFLDG